MPRILATNIQLRRRVARRLRDARLAKDLSQAQLAEAIGVSVESVSRYECGKLALSLELLSRAARALDVPIEQLVGQGPAGFSSDEVELVDAWRRLSERRRQAVLEIVRWGGEAPGDRHSSSS